MRELFKAVHESNSGRIHTRAFARAMHASGLEFHHGKAYYQIAKAVSSGYLVKVHPNGIWELTELGAAWCGAARVANT